ncbi:unnamed protein product, partial [Ectocarpus fasciculatus]
HILPDLTVHLYPLPPPVRSGIFFCFAVVPGTVRAPSIILGAFVPSPPLPFPSAMCGFHVCSTHGRSVCFLMLVWLLATRCRASPSWRVVCVCCTPWFFLVFFCMVWYLSSSVMCASVARV